MLFHSTGFYKVVYDHEIESLCFRLVILGKDRIAIHNKAQTDKAVVKSILEAMLIEKPKPAESRMMQFKRLYNVQDRQARQRVNTNEFLRNSEEAERKRDADRAAGYSPDKDTLVKQIDVLFENGEIPANAYEQALSFLEIPLDSAQSEPEAEPSVVNYL